MLALVFQTWSLKASVMTSAGAWSQCTMYPFAETGFEPATNTETCTRHGGTLNVGAECTGQNI